MKKWMAIPAMAGVLVIGGVAMATNATHASNINTANKNTHINANVENSVKATSVGLLTMEEAKEIAVGSVGGDVMKIELGHKKSGDVYEVEVQSGNVEYELDIDANTGKVLRTEQDDIDDDKNNITLDGNFISQEAAVKIAMKQAKGTVTEVELDEEHGRMVYEIEMKNGKYEYDIEIDAITGEVLKFNKERDND